jgi:hypothetical protein
MRDRPPTNVTDRKLQGALPKEGSHSVRDIIAKSVFLGLNEMTLLAAAQE